MALFGEKYGDHVRVVIIDPSYSIELCGGTHVGATGELGLLKILAESAVASGIRRIEAVSGEAAEEFINNELVQLQQLKEYFKNPKDLFKAISNLQEENNALKKRLEIVEATQLEAIKKVLINKVQVVNGFNFIGEIVQVPSAESLKKLAFDLKAHFKDYIITLGTALEGKAHIVLILEEQLALQKDLNATDIIKKHVAPLIKGGGGGQKNIATAGGQDSSALHQVIDTIKTIISTA
jgi:alanyl-tRNA synthetase